jgi:hypothetical protein
MFNWFGKKRLAAQSQENNFKKGDIIKCTIIGLHETFNTYFGKIHKILPREYYKKPHKIYYDSYLIKPLFIVSNTFGLDEIPEKYEYFNETQKGFDNITYTTIEDIESLNKNHPPEIIKNTVKQFKNIQKGDFLVKNATDVVYSVEEIKKIGDEIEIVVKNENQPNDKPKTIPVVDPNDYGQIGTTMFLYTLLKANGEGEEPEISVEESTVAADVVVGNKYEPIVWDLGTDAGQAAYLAYKNAPNYSGGSKNQKQQKKRMARRKTKKPKKKMTRRRRGRRRHTKKH